MFDKKFNIIIAVFLLLFISITYLSLSNNRLPFFTQASNKELDITKTVVIINKLEALADGLDQSTITIFTRNNAGVAVEAKQVDISTDLGTLDSTSSLSNSDGRAEFKLSSPIAGTANLQILVDNQPLSSPYSVKFVSN